MRHDLNVAGWTMIAQALIIGLIYRLTPVAYWLRRNMRRIDGER